MIAALVLGFTGLVLMRSAFASTPDPRLVLAAMFDPTISAFSGGFSGGTLSGGSSGGASWDTSTAPDSGGGSATPVRPLPPRLRDRRFIPE